MLTYARYGVCVLYFGTNARVVSTFINRPDGRRDAGVDHRQNTHRQQRAVEISQRKRGRLTMKRKICSAAAKALDAPTLPPIKRRWPTTDNGINRSVGSVRIGPRIFEKILIKLKIRARKEYVKSSSVFKVKMNDLEDAKRMMN